MARGTTGAKRGPLTERLYQALTFDQWVPLDAVYEELLHAVPPGRALRRYQVHAENGRRNKDVERRPRRELTESEQVRAGAHNLLSDALRTLTRAGDVLSKKDEEGKRWVLKVDRRAAAKREVEELRAKVAQLEAVIAKQDHTLRMYRNGRMAETIQELVERRALGWPV